MLNQHRRCWSTSIQYLPVNRAVVFLYHVPRSKETARTQDAGLQLAQRIIILQPLQQPLDG